MLGQLFKRWFRQPAPDTVAQLTLIDRDGSNRRVIHETHEGIEAPNWTPDGQWLVFNGGGRLFRLRATGAGAGAEAGAEAGAAVPEVIATGGVDGASNDHVVSPDGQTVYFTANARLFAVPLMGGVARPVHTEGPGPMACYLHGISPDGLQLCFVGVLPGKHAGRQSHQQAICTVSVHGGPVTTLAKDIAAVDGPEFSPDGQWIYFNAERDARAPGHAQIYRMKTDGTQVEQLTFDRRVNWFPHLSPDGRWVMYLSYPEGTQGHPANLDVVLRTIPAGGGEPVDVISLRGGQGTTNVNGWAPDSQRFAYVAYPLKTQAGEA